MSSFVPSRDAALSALGRFLSRAGEHYAEQRNYDFGVGARDNVSMLSPYLRHRLLSEEEVVRAVLNTHSLKQAEKFVQEVFWRTYWKGWLEQRPSIWTDYASQLKLLEDFQSPDLDAALEARTGIDCFDHWMRELTDTGYLHNHVRMWFASIWIFTLRLPWQKGAALFLEHLLDGDPASNTLSWRWVAGLQTVGKHYVADAGNIRRYTNGRFSPQGLCVAPAPLISGPHPDPSPIRALQRLPTGSWILLLTEEDMAPVIAPEMLADIAAVMLCPLAQTGTDKVNEFREAALLSSATDIIREYNVPLLAASGWSAQDWKETLADLAGIPLFTAYPPVGPLQSALRGLETDLAGAGHSLFYFRRQWDETCWPHARKGFFPFKEKIPSLLAQLEIG
jgi:deoxyribodipyrimidine photo-lyase